jgi:hypothetical protein
MRAVSARIKRRIDSEGLQQTNRPCPEADALTDDLLSTAGRALVRAHRDGDALAEMAAASRIASIEEATWIVELAATCNRNPGRLRAVGAFDAFESLKANRRGN